MYFGLKKMKRIYIGLNLITLIFGFAFAQTVETVVSHPKIVDGLFVDHAGNVYTCAGGLLGGNEIGMVGPSGAYTTFADGMAGSIDLVADEAGIFYITNYDDNTLKRYDPGTGVSTNLATNLNGPAGVEIDDNGYLYVTVFGAPPSYSGRDVLKISSTGIIDTLASGLDFFRPQGIAFDDSGNLYVANTFTGKIVKIDTATGGVTTLTSLSSKAVGLTFHDGSLYVAGGNGSHSIYKVEMDGTYSVFAGTGAAGGSDGPLSTAEFYKPLDIEFTSSGDTAYVSEAGANRLRRILLTPVGIDSRTDPQISISPNPTSGVLRIKYEWEERRFDSVRIQQIDGKVLETYPLLKGEQEFDISHLPTGVYMLVFEGGNVSIGRKLVLDK